ncbi:LOW QUALITY PROTEIN: citramalyl-CoA lyase, mitochondrial [Bufo gargarizans]|uniref:LOW QUALITY PROTEIN: citramalyl-CoA lyase, mitochondrial n=1 Tax=Bufo gargarizans TaxID=30331 RepID=UPI001CF525B8|nr:LOW QUALITY PROTEIN: citramalyl-CoA lyase, mitochondrial [Bufo gargarizans]
MALLQRLALNCKVTVTSSISASVFPRIPGNNYLRSQIRAAHKYIPRRAVLYIPGNDERKIQKIATLNVDCAVLDCEDGVAVNKKVQARETIVKALEEYDLGKTEKCVRINSVSSGLSEEDLVVILQSKVLPSCIMLPKVESSEEISEWFAEKFLHHLKGRKLAQPIYLVTFVETALGLLNFKGVCEEALQRGPKVGLHLDGVVFGAEDFRASIGATSSKEAHDVLYARQKIIVVAKAFGLQAIDLVYIDYKDADGLQRQAKEGALMGFSGKQVIHPSQIPIVQEQFTPSADKIKWAYELISAFQEHQRLGKGAFTFHGSMIDMPLLKQAQNIVTLATAIKNNHLLNEALNRSPLHTALVLEDGERLEKYSEGRWKPLSLE